ncbi:hypothetical protein Htur_1299 [Haloterrigena turkmenica DSM 5511]|uniref:Uncharacterized protein n=1 Tax=Haloterrigena turkmenica (strain ATCC 51198 / DSM 5511 / JCM 9101 / NCIMB 13204 / VKM B-1734 / 4k) TaxID=543526 RepID=D2RPF5_HALTV|nr:hypothetical protein Htur_1299 [Haloterrigena turkmenica DSM 5511]
MRLRFRTALPTSLIADGSSSVEFAHRPNGCSGCKSVELIGFRQGQTRVFCCRAGRELPHPPQPISPHGCEAPVRMVRGTRSPALTLAALAHPQEDAKRLPSRHSLRLLTGHVRRAAPRIRGDETASYGPFAWYARPRSRTIRDGLARCHRPSSLSVTGHFVPRSHSRCSLRLHLASLGRTDSTRHRRRTTCNRERAPACGALGIFSSKFFRGD